METKEIGTTVLRLMRRGDMERVIEIEQVSWADPSTRRDYLKSIGNPKRVVMVATIEEEVVGVVVYAISGEAIGIEKLAVDPDFRRRKIGSEMIEAAKSINPVKGGVLMALTVEHNLPAQLFFKSLGFVVVQVYRDEDETDSYIFRYKERNEALK